MSKVYTKDDVLHLLQHSDKAVVKAIKALYARQTSDEQSEGQTRHHNGRGFNGRDAEFFTSIAKALPRYNDNMTWKQLRRARAQLRKYWRQLLEEIEEKGGVVDYKATGLSAYAETPKREIAPITIPVEQIPTQEPAPQWGLF